jgi:hypothetical protein
MRALRPTDLLVVAFGVALFAVHFILTGLPSRLLSPWLIGAILVGWVVARIVIEQVERS